MFQLILSFAIAIALMSHFILNSLEQPSGRGMQLLQLFNLTQAKLAKISYISFFIFGIGCLFVLFASL